MQTASLLQGARAFARDFPRDQMPQGYLWDVVDYVPVILDAQLTGRGGWQWGSTVMGGDPETGILAGFTSGDKLLIQAADGQLYEVGQTDPYTATARGAVPRALQNPVQLFDTVIHFDRDGLVVPKLITAPGGVVTIGNMHATAPKGRYGAAYKSLPIVAGVPGSEDTLYYGAPGDPTIAFPANSVIRTSRPINGLIGLRSVLIVFHQGMVERVRGTKPPVGTDPGDLFLEPLTDRVGLGDARTIASWNDNVIWADEHGVHISDGAVIRNLIAQGGLIDYWRPLWLARLSVSGTTFLDNYIVTIRRTDGIVDTLICDLPQRQWYRFSHFPMQNYIASSGGSGMERVWGCVAGAARLSRIGPVFFPVFSPTGAVVDADGTAVLPSFETPWYRITKKEGRKRIRFFFLSYDVRAQPPVTLDDFAMARRIHDFGLNEDGGVLATLPAPGPRVLAPSMLSIGYIASPQELVYTDLGHMPSTDRYRRFRLPVGQHPYGVAFRVKQNDLSTVSRIFDFAVAAYPEEEGRL